LKTMQTKQGETQGVLSAQPAGEETKEILARAWPVKWRQWIIIGEPEDGYPDEKKGAPQKIRQSPLTASQNKEACRKEKGVTNAPTAMPIESSGDQGH